VPFAAAFAIALREGFELSLLLAALLAFLRKAGREGEARYVHLGWIVAIPAGAITWFAIGAALSGARRELTEGVLTLVAAAMLLFVSHFVLGRLESRRWLKFLERSTLDAGGKQQGSVGLALFSVAFVAAFREAIEIVLFFKALLLDSPTGPWPVIGGAAAGLSVLVVIVQVLARVGRRMNPRPLMLASSVVLSALAISLVGQGVRALQEGGLVGLSSLAWPRLPALGLYPTVQGLGAQLVVLLLVVVPTLLERRRAQPAPAS
jgi:high-affinity iron transporter